MVHRVSSFFHLVFALCPVSPVIKPPVIHSTSGCATNSFCSPDTLNPSTPKTHICTHAPTHPRIYKPAHLQPVGRSEFFLTEETLWSVCLRGRESRGLQEKIFRVLNAQAAPAAKEEDEDDDYDHHGDDSF